jgi:hypothetical protein
MYNIFHVHEQSCTLFYMSKVCGAAAGISHDELLLLPLLIEIQEEFAATSQLVNSSAASMSKLPPASRPYAIHPRLQPSA